MKRMLNEAATFREEMIDGFVAAYGRYARRVPDASGVMAVGAPVPGRVAVIIGGGSGHYPAFYGVVGEGLATAAVIGDVFTSPSGEQAYRVARAVDGGAGVLFSFGNYSGDVMNFGMAETRLRSEGIDARTVLVTDDEDDGARGVAGTQVGDHAQHGLGFPGVVDHRHQGEDARAHRGSLLVATQVGEGGLHRADGDVLGLPGADGGDARGVGRAQGRRQRRPSASSRRSASGGPQVPAS